MSRDRTAFPQAVSATTEQLLDSAPDAMVIIDDAANADEAIAVAGKHPGTIALLLTDVVMPGRSGKELAAEIAKLSPATRVLYMSGHSQDLIVHRGVLEAGVNLIEKPFQSEALLRRVREILDGR